MTELQNRRHPDCGVPWVLLIGRDADVWGYCDVLAASGHIVIVENGDAMLLRGERRHLPDVDLIVLVAGAGDIDAQIAHVGRLRQMTDVPLLVHGEWHAPGHGIALLHAGASGVLYGPWDIA